MFNHRHVLPYVSYHKMHIRRNFLKFAYLSTCRYNEKAVGVCSLSLSLFFFAKQLEHVNIPNITGIDKRTCLFEATFELQDIIH